MRKQVPIALQWQIDPDTFKRKNYLRDLDFIKEHTEVNLIYLASVDGVFPDGNPYIHEDIRELVDHAHQLGIRILLRYTPVKGFFDKRPYIIDDQKNAQGIVYDAEGVLDADGFAEFTQTARWARSMLQPLWNAPLKAYLFDSADAGFYEKDSLVDITDHIRVTRMCTDSLTVEIDAGAENAGKHVFLMTVQYFNWNDCFGDAMWKQHKALMDYYADIPLDGYCMDEAGYMVLDNDSIDEKGEQFRGRYYTEAQKQYFAGRYGCDLDRLLFDMCYAPYGEDGVRIRAINRYFEALQVPPVRIEHQVAQYAKKLWGDDVFLTCHNTYHNNLDNDEIWRTGCRWWDLPRDFGHTDESMIKPVRMGISFAAPEPLCIDMYYNKDPQKCYDHIIDAAPFNCRQFHHSYNDKRWGQDFKDTAFLEKIRKLDRTVAHLDAFQTERPKMDLLIMFGNSAQNNWYPYEENRNRWGVDGSLEILKNCDKIWLAGHRCALIPDYTVSDGRTRIENGKIVFNGHAFSHLMFLYPQYAKKEVIAFLNNADRAGIPTAVVGRCELDFDAEPILLTAPHYDTFSAEIPEKTGCTKSAIDDGCVYADGSFSLVTHGILTGESTAFDFTVDGVRYTGSHTGLLAYRKGEAAFATAGSELFADGNRVRLDEI